MADVPMLVFTDHDGNAYNIFTSNVVIELLYEGMWVEHKNAHVGITTDPIREYRIITCSCIMTGTDLNTMQAQLMDATKVYDGTDPKIAVNYDGTNSWTIYVATTTVTYSLTAHNEWLVSFRWVERSA